MDADAGLMPVQLRFETGLTGADYVTREAWREARLSRCPLHPRGGCGFSSHGTYERKSPAGTLIARWYCPQGHCTFSLLPDHLAARFPGTLCEIEHVVATVEQAKSVEAAADALRRDAITLASAIRWVRWPAFMPITLKTAIGAMCNAPIVAKTVVQAGLRKITKTHLLFPSDEAP